jgi:hypothetical protein
MTFGGWAMGGSTFQTAVADFCEILEFEICAGSVLFAFARNGLHHHPSRHTMLASLIGQMISNEAAMDSKK